MTKISNLSDLAILAAEMRASQVEADIANEFGHANNGEYSAAFIETSEMAKLSIPAEATVAPVSSFVDGAGQTRRIADFKGKVTVVNLWATWCAPCILEMPTLAKLAASYEGKPVEVVAVSIDTPDNAEKARAFIGKHAPLAFYHDPKMSLPFAVKPAAVGMPTTIIYGPDGVERGRVSGEADWSGKDARAVIDKVLAES